MILVSGGTGMLGAYLLSELVRNEEKIRAIKRTNSSLEQVKKIFSYVHKDYEKAFSRIEWVEADIVNSETVNEAMKGVTEVYHCAAMVSFNPAKKYQMIDINVKGTANMVNAALAEGVEKFCHVSSIAALGESEDGQPISEDTFRKPNKKYSGYSISKYRSELEVWRAISEGLNAVIVNPSVILGAWDWENGSSGIFKKVYQGLKFYTEGVTGYVDVWDVVHIMLKLMESNIFGERFIVSSENLSYKQILASIANSLNKPQPSIHAKPWMLNIVLVAEALKSKLTGKDPMITRDTAISAQSVSIYNNEKIKKALNYEFIHIEKTIKNITERFKKDFSL